MTQSPSDLPAEERLYSVMPKRAIQDTTLGLTTLRVLGALCIHANRHGIAWPSRKTIARHLGGRHPDTVSYHYRILLKKDYIRKLKGKQYYVPRRANHTWTTARIQVLYKGKAQPLPTREEFLAIKPRVIEELDGEAAPQTTDHKRQGVRGVETAEINSLKRAFCAGVERATGVNRLAEGQESQAATLVQAGISAPELLEAAQEMSLDLKKRGKPPPLSIKQVATWAGLG